MPDSETRRQIAKQGRLWLLSLLCAIAGTITIVETNSLGRGIVAFLVAVALLGPVLFIYEKRHRRP